MWAIQITAPPGAWSRPTVYCDGSATDLFRILKVPTGSPQDPLHGQCKQYQIKTQNILQVSKNNGSTWAISPCYKTPIGPWDPAVAGALACGNDKQTIASATFGTNCSAAGTQARCKRQPPCKCEWSGSHCGWKEPPPPPPSPPGPPGWSYKVGQAKFYGASPKNFIAPLLCVCALFRACHRGCHPLPCAHCCMRLNFQDTECAGCATGTNLLCELDAPNEVRVHADVVC